MPVVGGGIVPTYYHDTPNRPAGTITISGSGASAGFVNQYSVPIFASDCSTVEPRDETSVLSDFVFRFLQSKQEWINAELRQGAAQPHVYASHIAEIAIPLPPLEEQRRIVAALDEAFAAIAIATANAEKNLANARKLFEVERKRAFAGGQSGWKVARLRDLCTINHGFAFKSDYFTEAGEYVLLTPGNFFEGGGYRDRGSKQKYYDGPIPPGFVLKAGSLLVAMTEQAAGLLGSPIIVPSDGRFLHNQRLGLVQSLPGVDFDNGFFFHLFNTHSVRNELHKTGTGVKVRHTSPERIGRLEVNVPSTLAGQRTVASQLERLAAEIDAIVEVQEQKLVHLVALKQSLLRRAFSGEITERKGAVPAASNDNFATPQFAAQIVAFAYERHVSRNRARNFGTVKAEKVLHMVEAVGGIDLGRRPTRQAAGPDDAEHRHATWDWARSNRLFEFVKRGGGHEFVKLSAYTTMIDQARSAVGRAGLSVTKAIELLVDMDTEFAELVATTHAAWNNLVLDQAEITDDAIVYAARDDWHSDKMRYDKSRFHDAIRFIRSNGIEPDGSAKRVGGQESLPL